MLHIDNLKDVGIVQKNEVKELEGGEAGFRLGQSVGMSAGSDSHLCSKSVFHHLHKFKAAVLDNLRHFFSDLKQRLWRIEGDTQPVDYILRQQLPAVEAK
eukprot:g24092.t1